MKKFNYFMNGFQFQYLIFDKYLSNIFKIVLKYPSIGKYMPGYKYIPLNYLLIKKLYKTGEIQKYDIVHFNNTENFLNFKKIPNQISIAESHGFDFGVNYERFLKDEKNIIKKILGYIIDKLIGWKIRQKIQEFDIYYCSTPDMLEPLKKIRNDVKWLPNPINTDIFKPDGNIIKLEGNPACFFPTRLHGDKKPEYAIKIFQEYIKPNYPKATLHLLNQGFEVEKYKKLLNDEKTYFWHDFMDKETLASKIRGSDFCFGDFSIGGLSLMPMQIMACKKPIITYDMHELIKIERDELLDLTKKLFEDEDFKKSYIERNYKYIIDFHSEKSICKIHLENLKPFLKEKLDLSDEDINELTI
ncbi:glycosyltransferase [Candidatus Gracilibacteria bacterium]|nr:glycosyltransferase [Candidatus Gracilibacteria bacterium]